MNLVLPDCSSDLEALGALSKINVVETNPNDYTINFVGGGVSPTQ